ncbi:MAG: hypothetical protein ACMXYL_04570 [Candidatus Woesearchaeota archaeon]
MKRIMYMTAFALVLIMMSMQASAFSMQATPNTITLGPGEQSSAVTIQIQNTGNETIEILGLTRTGENSQILTGFNPTTIIISPDSTASITVTVSNPSTISPGDYTIGITALANTTVQNQTQLTVQVPQPTNLGFQFGDGPINLGGPAQEREQTVVGNIRIVNDQDTAVTNFDMQFTGHARYEYQTLTQVPTTIQPYETVNIQFRILIPRSQDAERRLIGNLAYTSAQGSGSVQVFLETVSKLTVDRVNFVADSGTTSSISDGELIRRTVSPGERFSFEVALRNEFQERGDTIEDTFVYIIIEDIDDGRDLEEESRFEDISGGRTLRHTVEFDTPSDADTGEYRVIMEVEGIDRNGAVHTQRKEYFMEVRRERNDVQIRDVRVTPDSLCIGEEVVVRVDLRNEGTVDQNNAAVRVQIDGLRFDDAQRFTVRRYDRTGNEYSGTFRIPTEDAPEGTYTVRTTAFYDGNQISDYEETTFRIIRCEPVTPPPPPPPEEPPVVIVPPTQPPVDETPPQPTERTTMDTLYMILLIIGNVAIVLIIILVIARLLSR